MAATLSGKGARRGTRTDSDLVVAGQLLSLIARGQARSRAELIAQSGLSRATVSQRLGALLDAGFVQEPAETMRSGGRPTRMLRLNTDFNVVLVADVGETVVRAAVTDLRPAILAESTQPIDLGQGPEMLLAGVARQFADLLGRIGRPDTDVLGIGLCLPAPVDFKNGRVLGPSVLAGWDDFDIRGFLGDRIAAPVFVENDVNLMTLAEWSRFWPEADHLLFIKIGTGIGSGMITGGEIYRGAQGAAGDIGHIQLGEEPRPRCRCGKLGCVEARAAGWALARDLRAIGVEARNARDVVALANAGHPEARALLRSAAHVIGVVAATTVSVLNPGVIVIGGTLAAAGDDVMSSIREVIHERALPLATRQLSLARTGSAASAGLLGAAQLTIDARLSRSAANETIASVTGRRTG